MAGGSVLRSLKEKTMLRLAQFLGTNLAIVLLISLTFRPLGLEGLFRQNGVDPNINALVTYSAIIGFAGSLMCLFLSKQMTKATIRMHRMPEEMAAFSINAGRIQALFSSHPPLEKRFAALEQPG